MDSGQLCQQNAEEGRKQAFAAYTRAPPPATPATAFF
jgi:hypothetical protein